MDTKPISFDGRSFLMAVRQPRCWLRAYAFVLSFLVCTAQNTVLLRNAADPGVRMPMAGLGMGNIGTYGNNSFDAVNATATFLKLGGHRTDAADSYGDEPGIGLAIREFLQERKASRTEVFIESKIGPGGLA